MAELAELGVRFFTDDGNGVQDARLMRRALEYARGLGVTLAQHCEDDVLAAGGAMHEGPGRPPRHPRPAGGGRGGDGHARHRAGPAHRRPGPLPAPVDPRSVELVAAAKAEGLAVTCEATPHHLTLTDERCAGYDPVFKVNPPLRTDDDVAAVRAGLADGTIDCIATDHAPHAPRPRSSPSTRRRPGCSGWRRRWPWR